MTQTGPMNLITDVTGLRVGNAQDAALKSGVTVLTADAPLTAGVHIMGGAPGTRDTALLAPDKAVTGVDAFVLSGGSAFGLDAASGVVDGLRADGRGFLLGGVHVPIVPAAILFDLANGGDKAWAHNPYAALGATAYAAATPHFDLGSVGAGTGATTATLKGGLGSASQLLPSGHTVGALVAVNPVGAATLDSGQFWAAPFEIGEEFGGRGVAQTYGDVHLPRSKLTPGTNTTIAIVATDAVLDKAGCTRMATAAQDGMARALVPSHTPLDGDLVFAVSTGAKPLADPMLDTLMIGHAAACCLARAIARAVYLAQPAPNDRLTCWSQRYGHPIVR
ncbi:P1 family peptidase [Rhodobacteraceae bacterium KMM 6894]|nr:P1 family peptidase [Rhodobacteraceae bacterium KMM 6894]